MSETGEVVLAQMSRLLGQALQVALANQTAIVIVPPDKRFLQICLNTLVRAVPDSERWKVNLTTHSLHVGERGSVRFYPSDHITYDSLQKRLRDYPTGVPTFILSLDETDPTRIITETKP